MLIFATFILGNACRRHAVAGKYLFKVSKITLEQRPWTLERYNVHGRCFNVILLTLNRYLADVAVLELKALSYF